ncbi:MAG: zf-HC2 domain-containing protein [Acidobacteriota bacterium]
MNHPADQILLDFVEGVLPTEDARSISRHLEDCPRCSALVADLSDFGDLEAPAAAYMTETPEVEAALGDLRARMLIEATTRTAGAEAHTGKEGGLGAPARSRPSSREKGRYFAVAATLLLSIVWGLERHSELLATRADLESALAAREELEERFEELPRPSARAEALHLVLYDVQVRSAPTSLFTARSSAYLRIQLTPRDPFPSGAQYSARIHRVGESDTVTVKGLLVPNDDGTLEFSILPGLLRPGNYEVVLTAEKSGERHPGRFRLRVE